MQRTSAKALSSIFRKENELCHDAQLIRNDFSQMLSVLRLNMRHRFLVYEKFYVFGIWNVTSMILIINQNDWNSWVLLNLIPWCSKNFWLKIQNKLLSLLWSDQIHFQSHKQCTKKFIKRMGGLSSFVSVSYTHFSSMLSTTVIMRIKASTLKIVFLLACFRLRDGNLGDVKFNLLPIHLSWLIFYMS